MKEIFLLEHSDAYAFFLAEKKVLGYTSESFLGVGTVSTYIPQSGKKGLAVYTEPPFFSQEYATGIIEGAYSAFNSNPILFQKTNIQKENPTAGIEISRWLFANFPLCLFQLPEKDIKHCILAQKFLDIEGVGDLMQLLMENLFAKIQEVRAQTIIFFFDSKMFHDYMKSFLLWLSFHRNKNELKDFSPSFSESDLQKKIIQEFLWYLADCALHPSLAIYPTTQNCFEELISYVRSLKKRDELSDKIVFRI